MADDPHHPEIPTPRPILTLRQSVEIAMLPIFLGLLFMVMLSIKYDYAKSLWETELGIKMMVGGLVQMFIGIAATTILYIVRNRLTPQPGSGWSVLLTLALWLTIVLFYMPMVFVILVGPAAIQIMEGLK